MKTSFALLFIIGFGCVHVECLSLPTEYVDSSNFCNLRPFCPICKRNGFTNLFSPQPSRWGRHPERYHSFVFKTIFQNRYDNTGDVSDKFEDVASFHSLTSVQLGTVKYFYSLTLDLHLLQVGLSTNFVSRLRANIFWFWSSIYPI